MFIKITTDATFVITRSTFEIESIQVAFLYSCGRFSYYIPPKIILWYQLNCCSLVQWINRTKQRNCVTRCHRHIDIKQKIQFLNWGSPGVFWDLNLTLLFRISFQKKYCKRYWLLPEDFSHQLISWFSSIIPKRWSGGRDAS